MKQFVKTMLVCVLALAAGLLYIGVKEKRAQPLPMEEDLYL